MSNQIHEVANNEITWQIQCLWDILELHLDTLDYEFCSYKYITIISVSLCEWQCACYNFIFICRTIIMHIYRITDGDEKHIGNVNINLKRYCSGQSSRKWYRVVDMVWYTLHSFMFNTTSYYKILARMPLGSHNIFYIFILVFIWNRIDLNPNSF